MALTWHIFCPRSYIHTHTHNCQLLSSFSRCVITVKRLVALWPVCFTTSKRPSSQRVSIFVSGRASDDIVCPLLRVPFFLESSNVMWMWLDCFPCQHQTVKNEWNSFRENVLEGGIESPCVRPSLWWYAIFKSHSFHPISPLSQADSFFYGFWCATCFLGFLARWQVSLSLDILAGGVTCVGTDTWTVSLWPFVWREIERVFLSFCLSKSGLHILSFFRR